jgi:hypothetical protein
VPAHVSHLNRGWLTGCTAKLVKARLGRATASHRSSPVQPAEVPSDTGVRLGLLDGSPAPHNKTWARDAETPRTVTPMKHAEEQNISTPDGSVPASDSSSNVLPAGAPPETPAVRKSGRQQTVPGRLKALNGEDHKLAHAKRRKRR